MKRKLVVWTLCVSLLLIGSVASAKDYSVLELHPGDCVQEQGNFVHDEYIEACRELQVYKDNTDDDVDEAPLVEGKGFINGMILGIPIGIIIMLL